VAQEEELWMFPANMAVLVGLHKSRQNYWLDEQIFASQQEFNSIKSLLVIYVFLIYISVPCCKFNLSTKFLMAFITVTSLRGETQLELAARHSRRARLC
jgi:hypothetical protein